MQKRPSYVSFEFSEIYHWFEQKSRLVSKILAWDLWDWIFMLGSATHLLLDTSKLWGEWSKARWSQWKSCLVIQWVLDQAHSTRLSNVFSPYVRGSTQEEQELYVSERYTSLLAPEGQLSATGPDSDRLLIFRLHATSAALDSTWMVESRLSPFPATLHTYSSQLCVGSEQACSDCSHGIGEVAQRSGEVCSPLMSLHDCKMLGQDLALNFSLPQFPIHKIVIIIFPCCGDQCINFLRHS